MPYYNMNTSTLPNFEELLQFHELELHPLSDIAIASLNKIIQDITLSREQKLRIIIEFNLSFAIVHYCMKTSKNAGQINEMDYAFMLLQLLNWYKVSSVAT